MSTSSRECSRRSRDAAASSGIGGGTVVHARDPELLAAIESRKAMITRLEGDPWLDTLVDVTL
jgi:hypothetical protein